MKHFLSTFLLGLISFISMLLFMEAIIIPNIPNEFSYKYDYVTTHKDDISILLIGNSYFENSINPSLIGDSVFDFASSARWVYYDLQLLNTFVPKMSNLHTVIYPMGYKVPFMSYHEDPRTTVDFYHQKYMHVWYNHFPQNVDRWLAVKYSDRIGFKPWSTYMDSTWKGDFMFNGHSGDTWREDQNISPEIIYAPNVEENIIEYKGYLTDMAKICQDNGVRFIVVTPPCHDAFNQNVRTEGIEKMYEIIEEIQLIIPFEYKNYLFDEEYRADSLHYNCSHLNKVGADKFALQIKRDFNLYNK